MWPGRTPVCRGSQTAVCLRIEEAIGIEEGRVEEPGTLWVDRPPPDIGLCSRCWGVGKVQRKDWEAGYVLEPCPRCGTTGEDPSWLG